jgi:hypothetical protein
MFFSYRAGLIPALFFLALPFSVFSANLQSIQQLSQSKEWLRLVHYKKTLLGGYKSEADGTDFFISTNGKTNPLNELEQTLEKFTKRDLKYICQFPARYMVLKKYVPDLTLNPLLECQRYREFSEKLSARSITLFFSSYYIDSPASIFGHTFLRMNKQLSKKNDPEERILDYAINYSAIMDGSDVFTYAIKGLTGIYQAKFFAQAFYYKVREYNDFESRDLWGYELEFSHEKVDLVVAHLWELGHTYFDYKFFTENCSYHILSLLEAVDPSLDLKEKLPSYYIIPIDTVRSVLKSLAVRSIEYRPSLETKIKNKIKKFTSEDKKIVKDIVGGNLAANNVDDDERRKDRLDTSIDLFDLRNSSLLLKEDPLVLKERFKLVSARAEIPVASQKTSGDKIVNPIEAHKSSRVGLSLGNRSHGSNILGFSHRFALHDLLDPQAGQPSFSQIEFLHTKFNYLVESKEFKINRVDFFTLSSFSPYEFYKKPISWTARLGLRSIQDRGCVDCMAGHVELGGGASVAPQGSLSFLSLLSKLELDYNGALAGSGRAVVGPEVWARLAEWESLSMLLKSGYKWGTQFDQFKFGQGLFTHSLELRYHATKSSSLSLKGEVFDEQRQSLEVGLLHFF